MLIYKGFKYRLYPTEEQVKVLESWERSCKTLWNLANEQRLMAYGRSQLDKKYPSFFNQRKDYEELRKEYWFFKELPFCVGDETLQELDKSWQRCFKKLAKAPHWKKKSDSIGIRTRTGAHFSIENNKLYFPKIRGEGISVAFHRSLEGKQKSCTISRKGTKWFVSIMCEIEIEDKTIIKAVTPSVVAIDRGIYNPIADSDGRLVPNPNLQRSLNSKIVRLQRQLAKKKKGSKNKDKARKKLQNVMSRLTNQRHDFQHKESRYYADKYNVIIFENLNTKGMTGSAKGTVEEPGKNVAQKAGLNKGILDAAWALFAQKTQYKVEHNGGTIIYVNPAYSSQECSCCGHVSENNRKTQAEFECEKCGFKCHADTNASLVLKKRGIRAKITVEKPKITLRKVARKKVK